MCSSQFGQDLEVRAAILSTFPCLPLVTPLQHEDSACNQSFGAVTPLPSQCVCADEPFVIIREATNKELCFVESNCCD